MDVGSRGGAWTRKSPKLLLLEWTQSHKQPKPRYKALPAAGGNHRCKVSIRIWRYALTPLPRPHHTLC